MLNAIFTEDMPTRRLDRLINDVETHNTIELLCQPTMIWMDDVPDAELEALQWLVEAQPVPLAPPSGPATRVHELFPRGVALEKPLVTSAACAPAALAGLAQVGAPPTRRCTCTRPVAAAACEQG